jgi:hypothetical protein
MTLIALTDCCAMLGVDPKTLRNWLKHAPVPVAAHPTDARIKCLTLEHVHQLATLHGRPHRAPASAPAALPAGASALASSEEQAARHPQRQAAHLQAPHRLPTSFPQEADLNRKLVCLETQVATMQHHLTQLALELLQERELRYERRLQALEALLPHPAAGASPSPTPSSAQATKRQEGPPHQRRLPPTHRRPRSRILPLIEYAASGRYVVICPTQGELLLEPDSPEWFAWLASLSSFRFVGKGGRFSAHRVFHQEPTP